MPKIICRWGIRNRFVANPDGQVWPCCYFANSAFRDKIVNGDSPKFSAIPLDGHAQLMKKYDEHKDDLNLDNKTYKEVLEHDWFQKWLPESWVNNPSHKCIMMCSKKEDDPL